MDVTTVADDLVVLHEGTKAHRFTGLAAGTEHRFFDLPVRTLDRPGGALLCRFATVNDVHFGEIEAAGSTIWSRAPSSAPLQGPTPIPK